MLRRIVDSCGNRVRMRLIDRDEDPDLRDELRILGAMRVPVAVFLTEDSFEVGRFGDRMLVRYRKMLGREGEAPTSEVGEMPRAETAGWVDLFERILLMTDSSPYLRKRYGD